MAKLSDRMMRADIFADGRLLRISPEARLLAIALEGLAESTGMVRRDADEIRSACGFFLSDAEGTPPSRDAVLRWCDELAVATWALDFTSGGMRLLYLQGFGKRQKGLNVAIGAESTNAKPSSHLPMPACVTLEAFEETVKNTGEVRVRKYLPNHCDSDHTCCPCEWYPQGSPTVHEPKVTGEESLSDLKELDPEGDDEKNEVDVKGGEDGEGGTPPSDHANTPDPLTQMLDALCEQYPRLNRQSLSTEILWLDGVYGTAAVVSAIRAVFAQGPKVKAPLEYTKRLLRDGS
jgi:hypothetical protein